MHILEEKLLNEIEFAKSRIDKKRQDEFVREMFKCLADQTIENASIQDGDNAQRSKEVIANFKNAWDYGIDKFKEPVDLVYLTDIAGRVEPGLRASGEQFANIRVGGGQALPGIKYVPPCDGFRVREHLVRTFEAMNSSDWHPIEKAVYLNFHLVRIQPFQNANKRTANIVMNAMLKSNDFFPISFPPSQTPRYDGYLEGAIRDFQTMGANSDDVSQPYKFPGYHQKRLFDFLARIELRELHCAEDKMTGLSRYDIQFATAEVPQMYAVKHQLHDWLRAHNMLHEVRLTAHDKSMKVVGDIPQQSIERVLKGMRNLGKYTIAVSNVNNGTNHPYGAQGR